MTNIDWEQIRQATSQKTEAVAELTMRICQIPAPTGSEQERATFVASLLRERGYSVDMDAISNVYTHRGKGNTKGVVMLIAHTDTVFPEETPIIIQRDGDIIRGPGIWDNSVGVATMLTTLDILDELKIETERDIIIAAVVGEEGLGNLRGTRAAIERYRDQLAAVVVLDGRLGQIVHEAVGSKRWRIEVHGPGGHSFGAFGQPSAIHGLGKIIAAIADISVPQRPKTTFNVGMISGGTSINTIAPDATALLDMRSSDIAALEQLASQARSIIEQVAGAGLETKIIEVGERPAGKREQSDKLIVQAAETLRWLGYEPSYHASSTDANIPISLGIPSVCIGVTLGDRAHTREEFLHVAPIGSGLAQVIRLLIEACKLT